MASLHSRDDSTEAPTLRREVIVPKARDALAFHRRIAVLSIFVAILAGSLDAMLWREAQRDAEQRRARAEAAAERVDREAFAAGADVQPHDLRLGDDLSEIEETPLCRHPLKKR